MLKGRGQGWLHGFIIKWTKILIYLYQFVYRDHTTPYFYFTKKRHRDKYIRSTNEALTLTVYLSTNITIVKGWNIHYMSYH